MDDRNAGRQAAIDRLEKKRDLRSHVLIYMAVNTTLVVIWAVSGAGYFWPIWPILGWGIGLALTTWNVYGRRPITEDDIRRETRRNTAQDAESAGN